ncbi:CDP-alcohol phosphatidyltransferase [Apiospora marii]|uniref:CDP-alcohol phosphatidyltransferase n=1 Tax=Apiospora marii TaxID=335849 RepID=UPI00312CC3AB
MSSRLFLASSSRGANAIRTTVEAPMLLGFGPASLSSGTTTLAGALLGRTPMLNLARRPAPPPPPVDPRPAPSGLRKVLPIPSLTPHEDIYTIPNLLTASRLVVAPFIGYAILHDAHAWTLGLFVYAGVSDLLDGWIARRWKLQSVVGSVIDPMADKILMTILTVCLATKGALPVWLAGIILGRDVGLGFAAIYYRWISLPPPKTFMRYWDFSLPSPRYTVAATTVWSGLSYVFSKDAVKILSDSKAKKE